MSKTMVKKGSLQVFSPNENTNSDYSCYFTRNDENVNYKGITWLSVLVFPDDTLKISIIVNNEETCGDIINSPFDFFEVNCGYLRDSRFQLTCELNSSELSNHLVKVINFLDSVGSLGEETKMEILEELSFKVNGLLFEYEIHNDISQESRGRLEKAQTIRPY